MKILVATPCYGGQVTDLYMRSIISLIHTSYAMNVEIDVLAQFGESLIPRARNDIFKKFLEGDWTHLLWIDGDIGFSPDNMIRLLASGYDVCAVPYPLKKLDWEDAALMSSAAEAREAAQTQVINYKPDAVVQDEGFVEVIDAGTGFMLVTRDAAELMILEYPALHYFSETDGAIRWALFDPFIDDGRYLSEDYAFCRRWQAMGGQVMVDTQGPQLQHRGFYTYGE